MAASWTGHRPRLLRVLAVVAACDWLIGITLVAAGVRRGFFLGLVVAAAGVLFSLQLPRACRSRLEPARPALVGGRDRAGSGVVPTVARWVLREPGCSGRSSCWSAVSITVVAATVSSGHRDALQGWVVLTAAATLELAVTPLFPLPGWVLRVLLVAGLWGLVVVAGLVAALVVHPHVVEPSRVRLRVGFWDELDVPRTGIEQARIARGSAPRGLSWPTASRASPPGARSTSRSC